MKLDPHDTWIYYQGAVGIATSLNAFANVGSMLVMGFFLNKAVKRLESIDRNTAVVRTDVLLKRRALTLAKKNGTSVREQVELAMEQDEFRL